MIIFNTIFLQKAARRLKGLRSSTTTSEIDKKKFSLVLKASYMSSEESETASEQEEDEEGAPKRITLVAKKLPWRSDEIENAFQSLDKRVQRKRSRKATAMTLRRRPSAVTSACMAPLDAPRWAVRPASQLTVNT